ncbi:MAG: adenine deaminase [bacterium]|jgi:adenine deaminase
MKVSGNIVKVADGTYFPGTIEFKDGRIINIRDEPKRDYERFVIPGFIDAHVHVESSMLVPSEFARQAVRHGTVASVSDPHEIANVLGDTGVRFMIENGKNVPFKFFFGAPSCVPATAFETSGAKLGVPDVQRLLQQDDILYLSEMMNFPGVISGDPDCLAKIAAAKKLGKPIDGHAPGLRGDALKKYISAGISTDHECFEIEEAKEKIELGMKIIIREGSAARNFDELLPLVDSHPDSVMFGSDDKHPNELIKGHINELVMRAVGAGINWRKVLKCACINPIEHYGLPVGRLRIGDSADFVIVDDLSKLKVRETYIAGELVAVDGNTNAPTMSCDAVNRFKCTKKIPENFQVRAGGASIQIIEAVDGQIVTGRAVEQVKAEAGFAVPDTSRDILKLTVVNRYNDAPPAVAFVRGFGLKKGAMASSVAHDSHNIIAVGADDVSLARAVNEVIRYQGGMTVVTESSVDILSLPVAGLMTNADGGTVAREYDNLEKKAKSLGLRLASPFMTLSFMALLVIPSLKLSDKGLFDGDKFDFAPLFV